jgi:hypothetical protein
MYDTNSDLICLLFYVSTNWLHYKAIYTYFIQHNSNTNTNPHFLGGVLHPYLHYPKHKRTSC